MTKTIIVFILSAVSLLPLPEEDLFEGSLKGDLDSVRKAVKAGADVNSRSKTKAVSPSHPQKAEIFHRNSTPLMYASREGHLSVAEFLIENGADPNASDESGNTALLHSAGEGHFRITELLVRNGAEVNVSNSYFSPFYLAFDKGHRATAEFLADNSADLNFRDRWGVTVLIKTVLRNDADSAEWLLRRKADPNVRNQCTDGCREKGWTALFYAVKAENPELIKSLLKSGGDIDAADEEGRTPLIHSSLNSLDVSMAALLPFRPNLHHIDRKGVTALTAAILNERSRLFRPLLEKTFEKGSNSDYRLRARHFFQMLDAMMNRPESEREYYSRTLEEVWNKGHRNSDISAEWLRFLAVVSQHKDFREYRIGRLEMRMDAELEAMLFSSGLHPDLLAEIALQAVQTEAFLTEDRFFRNAAERSSNASDRILNEPAFEAYRRWSSSSKAGYLYDLNEEKRMPKILFQAGSLSNISDFQFSKDGRIGASLSGSRILVWNSSGTVTASIEGSVPFDAMKLSLDGRSVAASHSGTVFVWDTDGHLRFRTAGTVFCISPDGNSIGVKSSGSEVSIFSPEGKFRRLFKADAVSLSFSADSRTLSAALKSGDMIFFNMEGEGSRTVRMPAEGIPSSLEIFGEDIIYIFDKEKSVIYNFSSGKVSAVNGRMLGGYRSRNGGSAAVADGEVFEISPSGRKEDISLGEFIDWSPQTGYLAVRKNGRVIVYRREGEIAGTFENASEIIKIFTAPNRKFTAVVYGNGEGHFTAGSGKYSGTLYCIQEASVCFQTAGSFLQHRIPAESVITPEDF